MVTLTIPLVLSLLKSKETTKKFLYRIGIKHITVISVQTNFPPTLKKRLDYKSPIPPVTVASVSNQQRQFTRHLSTFLKQTAQTCELEPTELFEHNILC